MDYSKLTVVKLKEELKSRGIASTGLSRKQQIIDRLEEEDVKQNAQAETTANDDEDVEEATAAPEPEATTTEAEATPDAPEATVEPTSKATAGTSAGTSAGATAEPTPDSTAEPTAEPTAEDTAVPTADLQAHSLADKPAEPSNKPVIEKDVDEKDKTQVEETVHEQLEDINGAESVQTAPENGNQTPVATTKPPGNATVTSAERKRKRRSASPPVAEAEIKKKLKQDEMDAVHIQAEGEVQDDDERKQEAHHQNTTEPRQNEAAEDGVSQPARDIGIAERVKADPVTSVAPAIHPATNSLYVRNLKRPLQLQSFKQHLNELAQEGDALTLFHLDAIRTHAFVRFISTKAASRVRSNLHDRIWPDERDREPLWVDFIPEDRIEEWVSLETQGGESGRGASMRRWEVAYAKEQDGTITATLQEASEVTSRQPFYSDQRALKESRAPSQPVAENNLPEPVAFANLDQRFKSTTAKPKLYWLPVSQKLADARLDEIDARTTRRGTYPSTGSGWSDSRRYTFEEDDRLVDGGPEFGLRQGRSRAGPTTARRDRLGPRGRGIGGRGDSWR